jgi:hypothetical protein
MKALVAVTYFGPRWCRLTLEASNLLFEQGYEVVTCDLSLFQFPSKKTLFGSGYFRTNGFELSHPHMEPRVLTQPSKPKFVLADGENSLPKMMESELYSYFSTDRIHGTLANLFVYISKRRMSKLLSTNVVNNLQEFDLIILQNGRYFVNQVIRELARSLSISVKFLETGLPNNPAEDRYFFEDFPIHDRISRQKAINAAEIDLSACEAFVDSWLEERRRPGSKTNKFSAGWVQSQENLPKAGNLFLTSSTDEYWALGSQWHEADWADQYEAFDVILSKLESMGEENSILRIHPNLLNKSIRFIRTEKKRIEWLAKRHPNLKVLGPKNPANTYSLMESARRVFVSISTAGLEASASGKPVWCVMSTNYDLVADVRRIHSAHAATDDHLQVWDVDSKKAKKFIGYRVLEGEVYKISSKVGRTFWTQATTIPLRDLWFRISWHVWRMLRRLVTNNLRIRGT